ncbi:hypothetical protein [Kitasatospora sp. LaBMicrA B282]|uniref:hypothetical protein n=1 Tax=Kitasatospora sp. LaBMicrA B282 TaxID=3420949 RepID=UPI003D0D62BD
MNELQYQLYQQRGAELRELASHRRQVEEARRANRTARTASAGGNRLGRLAGLRRPAHGGGVAVEEC